MSLNDEATGSRQWQRLTEKERRARADKNTGEPILAPSADTTPYSEYQNLHALFSLQKVRTSAPTEVPFYIVGQVKELLFKLITAETRLARDLLLRDDIRAALHALARVVREQRLLTAAWDILSSLTPNEFAEFRDDLGSASGLQSFAYRELEFVLGNKDPRMLRPHEGDLRVTAILEQALSEPSLYDAALDVMRRRGIPLPERCPERDLREPYQPDDAVVDAWHLVYQEPDHHGDLHQLAESLMDVAFEFSRWRATHLLTVERILGDKVGSGGSSGAQWLRKVATHRFFPELWDVRDRL